ncbi:uncharacterized protein L969DRAFT_51715 [Mixia osmundae IAM 14324]|uniref:Uncharacterized protein n=1 Tax=Mixia osmundae (strain CBS 9802 / IAM 14324 / JCM 22182 / KY 12970) TaxID=764103 RepID=G7DSI6_MIXOS|nr:uncharacterized protein L969DRAFT_51715 [Mixia osmundae IAM 14324]KEI37956.1 hypothetical protein L969DRAFT_51715 [Mixia osmundae IAM 14324]GAA93546.1 hypothetical protein E5Q_00190 [Mixia osmundae IAM 14324]
MSDNKASLPRSTSMVGGLLSSISTFWRKPSSASHSQADSRQSEEPIVISDHEDDANMDKDDDDVDLEAGRAEDTDEAPEDKLYPDLPEPVPSHAQQATPRARPLSPRPANASSQRASTSKQNGHSSPYRQPFTPSRPSRSSALHLQAELPREKPSTLWSPDRAMYQSTPAHAGPSQRRPAPKTPAEVLRTYRDTSLSEQTSREDIQMFDTAIAALSNGRAEQGESTTSSLSGPSSPSRDFMPRTGSLLDALASTAARAQPSQSGRPNRAWSMNGQGRLPAHRPLVYRGPGKSMMNTSQLLRPYRSKGNKLYANLDSFRSLPDTYLAEAEARESAEPGNKRAAPVYSRPELDHYTDLSTPAKRQRRESPEPAPASPEPIASPQPQRFMPSVLPPKQMARLKSQARPSPLRNLALQAATPSPPAKKPVQISPTHVTTAAALMLDIIKDNETAASKERSQDDVVNPYETSTAALRATRARAERRKPKMMRKRSPAVPKPQLTIEEQLRLSMPPEYRKVLEPVKAKPNGLPVPQSNTTSEVPSDAPTPRAPVAATPALNGSTTPSASRSTPDAPILTKSVAATSTQSAPTGAFTFSAAKPVATAIPSFNFDVGKKTPAAPFVFSAPAAAKPAVAAEPAEPATISESLSAPKPTIEQAQKRARGTMTLVDFASDFDGGDSSMAAPFDATTADAKQSLERAVATAVIHQDEALFA